MSDFDTEVVDDEDSEPEGDGTPKRKPGKAERQLIRENAEKDAKIEAQARELVFLEAKLPDTPAAKLLRKAYDGDISVEAVRNAAVEYGVVEPEAPKVSDDELEEHEAVAQAAAGASGPSTDQRGSDEYKAELAKASSREEAFAVMEKYGVRFADTD